MSTHPRKTQESSHPLMTTSPTTEGSAKEGRRPSRGPRSLNMTLRSIPRLHRLTSLGSAGLAATSGAFTRRWHSVSGRACRGRSTLTFEGAEVHAPRPRIFERIPSARIPIDDR